MKQELILSADHAERIAASLSRVIRHHTSRLRVAEKHNWSDVILASQDIIARLTTRRDRWYNGAQRFRSMAAAIKE